ncbi:MAG: hypothetical protein HYY06_10185 [Deltaproteobacteria bacterium]|nr:hypothetical protein [Deltaproteobacteria bacterium]
MRSLAALTFAGALVVAGCTCGGETTVPAVDASAADTGPDAPEDAAIDAAAPDSGPDAGVAPIGNAMLMGDGTVVPLYPVSDPGSPAQAIGFVAAGGSVRALDEDGELLWETATEPGVLFGGFDFDADGWPDAAIGASEPTGELCGEDEVLDTWIDFIQGRTGAVHSPIEPLESICWSFPGTTYPTHQWGSLGVLFGPDTPTLAVVPYYAETGWFFDLGDGGFASTTHFLYPSTAAYDAAYTADQPDAHGAPHSYVEYSHVANGMILSVGGESRLVFFTSARVVQYAVAPFGAGQLLHDTPFLAGCSGATIGQCRTDLVGRNYGRIARDPSYPDHLVLVAGTSADTVFDDMRSGTMASDPWGQIERHVVLYDLTTAAVIDRFLSYAHDGGDAYQYEGRLVYPETPIVPSPMGSPSRIAFNLYEGGHWNLHVTAPGSVEDDVVIRDIFLWDIRDLDLDGEAEWLLSPSRDPEDPDVPGYYFVKWRTLLSRWDEAATSLATVRQIDDAIPYLQATFRLPDRTTSRSYLYPALTARTPDGLALLIWRREGSLGTVLLGQ